MWHRVRVYVGPRTSDGDLCQSHVDVVGLYLEEKRWSGGGKTRRVPQSKKVAEFFKRNFFPLHRSCWTNIVSVLNCSPPGIKLVVQGGGGEKIWWKSMTQSLEWMFLVARVFRVMKSILVVFFIFKKNSSSWNLNSVMSVWCNLVFPQNYLLFFFVQKYLQIQLQTTLRVN